MITKRQEKYIEDRLRNHEDQSPEFQEFARQCLVKEAEEYNERTGYVGYKCPPRHTRFKKGGPGGPGRPKADAFYRIIVGRLAKDNHALLERIVQGVLDRALKGKPRDIKLLVDLVERRRA